ncbi:MAG: hypothetical protein KatS3mg101_0913 [Patescibacteria group bacterium]|nr:MAG: hypothetical protein KatS3mg101_0913 [Patescibacteria group bacterium]
MTKYEYARLLGTLAKLYEKDFPVHPKLMEEAKKRKIYDPLDLATLHLSMKELPCPILLVRRRPDGSVLKLSPREMILPDELTIENDSLFNGGIVVFRAT